MAEEFLSDGEEVSRADVAQSAWRDQRRSAAKDRVDDVLGKIEKAANGSPETKREATEEGCFEPRSHSWS
jgi:hypothetical protein